MHIAPRLIACGLAVTAFVLAAVGLVLDRVAAAEDVSGYRVVVAVPVPPRGNLLAGRR